jgi:signal transduction histidine kinase
VALYRIAQEALNNVAKHSGANQAAVSLRYSEMKKQGGGRTEGPRSSMPPGLLVELRISDDGRGVNLAQVSPQSLGLSIMRERAEAIGATLTIESQPGQGTQVSVVWQNEGRYTKDERG